MAASTSSGIPARILGAVLAAVVAMAAFVLMVAALLFGLMVAAVVWIWALVRGRRPNGAAFRVYRGGFPRRERGPGPRGGPERRDDDVIDGAVREVPEKIDGTDKDRRR